MTPTQPTTPQRRIRWQFSLRMMLLLTALVGVSLAIYRWPWVESKWHDVMENDYLRVLGRDPFGTAAPFADAGTQYTPKLLDRYESRTTYRRNWRAQPVKNGVEQFWRDGRMWQESHFYEGKPHGPKRGYNKVEKLVFEANYRGGALHGAFRAGDGQAWIQEGTFDNGEPHGAWREIVSLKQRFEFFPELNVARADPEGAHMPDDPIVLESNWQHGERHGLWTWKTVAGEVLDTAEYDQNNLVRWNGEPVAEQFLAWLRKPSINDGALLQFLSDASDSNWEVASRVPRDSCFCVRLSTDKQSKSLLFVHGVDLPRDMELPSERKALASALCEMAVQWDYQFDYRYGGLWLVPRAESQKIFVDPTGVSQLKFETGSEQERDWVAIVMVPSSEGSIVECVTPLLQGTTLQFDIASVPAGTTPPPSYVEPCGKILTRRRRDVIGLSLFLAGCRCERRGDQLVFLQSDDRSIEQMFRQPFQPPFFPEPRGCYR